VMEYQGKFVVVTEARSGLPRALSEAFAQDGAKVNWIAKSTDVDEFARTHQPPDALIVAVPHFSKGLFAALGEAAWQDALQGELGRAIHVLRAIGAQMAERRSGCIVLVGTLAGTTGFPEWTLASTVEGALVALTRSLACEWAAQNVRIVYLACGAVEGDLAVGADADVMARRTPLGRLGTTEEIAQAVLFLSSSRASFTTGSVLRVDGGWSAWGLLK
jgi:NAD(P)-dependent dehydrogenase (short-subunit alcohol dehydrogenase family)